MEDIMPRLSPVVLVLSLIAAAAATSVEAAQRAFVSSSGSDANTASGCGLAAPCRSFASAHTVVSAGGEIVALDAAGYGPITITKNVTITANPGFYAGIAVASGDGVTIATAGINVTLRGLNINGTGGARGVVMINGNRLSIENCVISNFTGNGVDVQAPAIVRIVDSLIRDNGNDGANIQDGATAAISGSKFFGNGSAGVLVISVVANVHTSAAVSDSVLSGNFIGIWGGSLDATSTARTSASRSTFDNNSYAGVYSQNLVGVSTVTVSANLITGNTIGLYAGGANGLIESLGNNTVRLSTSSNTTGTITAVSGI
jgi:Right handed beta helix region